MSNTTDVLCSHCNEKAQISTPADPGIEVRWKCFACGETNLIEGHPGELGEGAYGNAITMLDDDALVDAAVRRGLISAEHVEMARAVKAAGEVTVDRSKK